MKKLVCLFLSVIMLLGLVACGSANGDSAPATTEAPKEFMVGYARVNITPDVPTGLAGYGNIDERKHTEVLDYIYLTCVAMTDTEDNTALFFSADLCSMSDTFVASIRTKVSEATGVPGERMMFNSSHTHSAPYGQGIPQIVTKAAVEAAEDAIADRKPATMFAGKAETDGINFVRHYYMDDGSVVTDNHGTTTGKTIVSHTTETDEEMRILLFKREGGKDVVLANWQSHPHITGGSTKTALSADIIGMFRMYLEQQYDCQFAYFQGGGGNINPTSRIKEENANTEKDYKVHGQLLAETAMKAINSATEIQTGPIRHVTEIYSCDTNKEDLSLASAAATVVAYYNEGHTTGETKTFAQQYGIESIYHARAISGRGSLGDSLNIEIDAFGIGDFGWVLAPYEMFDASAKYIRDNSPFAFTFACGYSNGGNGYFPTLECWEYGAYEADTTKVARGTAEAVADRFVELLNDLHGQ